MGSTSVASRPIGGTRVGQGMSCALWTAPAAGVRGSASRHRLTDDTYVSTSVNSVAWMGSAMRDANGSGETETACAVERTMLLRGDESRIDPEIFNHPYPFYRALRRQAPVYYDAKLDTYIVTRFDDIAAIMKDNETFSLAGAFEGTYASGRQDEFYEIMRREGGGVFAAPRDPPEHTRIRRLMLPLFTTRRVKALEDRTRQIVIELIEPLVERGYADGIKEIGVPMTARIMCEQLGLDFGEVGAERFAQWSRVALAQMGRRQSYEQMLENARILAGKQRLIIDTIKARTEAPCDDMISQLVNARIDDDERPELEFGEIVAIVSALMVAGADTTAAALANLMLSLATEPKLVPRLREAAEDDRLISRFVEETLRLHPPSHGLWRSPRRDVEIGGVTIPSGSQVCVMFASANDDETHFRCPRNLDVDRGNTLSHLTFGMGIHRCVGAPLARMEIKVAAGEIIRRLDGITLAIPVEKLTYVDTLVTQTLERLPLTFSRRSAGTPSGS